jgi:hypothetical protein
MAPATMAPPMGSAQPQPQPPQQQMQPMQMQQMQMQMPMQMQMQMQMQHMQMPMPMQMQMQMQMEPMQAGGHAQATHGQPLAQEQMQAQPLPSEALLKAQEHRRFCAALSGSPE